MMMTMATGTMREGTSSMSMMWTALGLKWLSVWVVLLLLTIAFMGPTPGQAAVIAAFVAVISYTADRLLPFRVQGVTRWALDAGGAALGIWLGQFLWPGTPVSWLSAMVAGAFIGAIELPLHFWLASRFGLRRPDDRRDGVR